MPAFVVVIFLIGSPLTIEGSPSKWPPETWEVFDGAVARGGHPELHSWINGKYVITKMFEG